MNKFTRTLTRSFERAEDMRGDIRLGFDLETRGCNITVELRRLGWYTEICIK